MKLFSSQEFNYVGYMDGKHVFDSVRDNMRVLISEAKFRLAEEDKTFICKDGGEIELSYSTQRRLQRCDK